MKDKSYRVSVVGGEVGRYMRALRWSDKAQNTLDTYEIVLAGSRSTSPTTRASTSSPRRRCASS